MSGVRVIIFHLSYHVLQQEIEQQCIWLDSFSHFQPESWKNLPSRCGPLVAHLLYRRFSLLFLTQAAHHTWRRRRMTRMMSVWSERVHVYLQDGLFAKAFGLFLYDCTWLL